LTVADTAANTAMLAAPTSKMMNTPMGDRRRLRSFRKDSALHPLVTR
jgi:hypothetical protein